MTFPKHDHSRLVLDAFLGVYHDRLRRTSQEMVALYKDDSQLWIDDSQVAQQIRQPVRGLMSIEELLTSTTQGSSVCSVDRIHTQWSLGNSVLAYVSGTLLYQGCVRSFRQTLVLAPQGNPVGYYVLNDMMHILPVAAPAASDTSSLAYVAAPAAAAAVATLPPAVAVAPAAVDAAAAAANSVSAYPVAAVTVGPSDAGGFTPAFTGRAADAIASPLPVAATGGGASQTYDVESSAAQPSTPTESVTTRGVVSPCAAPPATVSNSHVVPPAAAVVGGQPSLASSGQPGSLLPQQHAIVGNGATVSVSPTISGAEASPHAVQQASWGVVRSCIGTVRSRGARNALVPQVLSISSKGGSSSHSQDLSNSLVGAPPATVSQLPSTSVWSSAHLPHQLPPNCRPSPDITPQPCLLPQSAPLLGDLDADVSDFDDLLNLLKVSSADAMAALPQPVTEPSPSNLALRPALLAPRHVARGEAVHFGSWDSPNSTTNTFQKDSVTLSTSQSSVSHSIPQPSSCTPSASRQDPCVFLDVPEHSPTSTVCDRRGSSSGDSSSDSHNGSYTGGLGATSHSVSKHVPLMQCAVPEQLHKPSSSTHDHLQDAAGSPHIGTAAAPQHGASSSKAQQLDHPPYGHAAWVDNRDSSNHHSANDSHSMSTYVRAAVPHPRPMMMHPSGVASACGAQHTAAANMSQPAKRGRGSSSGRDNASGAAGKGGPATSQDSCCPLRTVLPNAPPHDYRLVTPTVTARNPTPSPQLSFKLASAATVELPEPPLELCCPITTELLAQPVVAADGHVYSRAAIAQWLQCHDISPMTGAVLPSLALTQCTAATESVRSWCESHGVAVP